jgi:predicted dithiol-disulfide oxidoreductase (DUF899 family)
MASESSRTRASGEGGHNRTPSAGSRSATINVFLHHDGKVSRTYCINGPALEALGSVWSLLELTTFGRQETTEESPAGWPQGEPRARYRLHDEYNGPAK